MAGEGTLNDEAGQETRFVLGRGRFVDDIKMDGMLHLHIIRSPYARARIISVSGGINGKELKADMVAVGEDAGEGKGAVSYPVLATESVNYAGQPVAAVLGADRYEAEDKAEEVDIQYDPLKPIVDPMQSLASDPIHPGTRSNLISESTKGKDFSVKAPVEVEETLKMERVTPNPLEMRGVVAAYDGSTLTVYASTQSVFSWREGLSSSLGMKEESVRVIQMDTGGAFGSKGGIYPEYVVAAYAAMKLRRPVKWVENRYEHLMATEQGRGARGTLKVFADKRGKILGLKGDLVLDSGAYPLGGDWATGWIAFQLTGPYAISKAYVRTRAVYTNKVPSGPYRGAGRPEAAFFMERMIDRVADETGIDPAEVRLANATAAAFESPLGLRTGAFRPFLREALSAFNYPKRKRSGNVGLSCFVLVPAAYGGESAKVAVADGRLKVWMGGSSHGQGHDVFARRLVSKELGVSEDLIDVELSDTRRISSGVGSWGSRTAMLGGSALIEASRKLKAGAKRKLGKKYSVESLLRGGFEAEAFFEPKGSLVSFGANLVTAKVKSGMAVIDEIVSYYDVGEVLNRYMVESQIVGGFAQAVGEVLYEQALFNEDGQLLTATLADSGVPHATEMPRFKVMTASHRSQLPHGAKGVGESPTIGVPPAATRALEVTLKTRFTTLPIESEKLWAKPPSESN